MRSVLTSFALAAGAFFVLALGIFFAAAVGLTVRGAFGYEYELYGFWGSVLVLAGIAAMMYRWQDSLLGWLGPLIGRGAPELLFCQLCGTVVRHDAAFCPQCAGTRFGFAKPGTGPASRWHVQIGMDVIDRDGAEIGVVKRKRGRDFLVARPRRRDVYVPMNAIARSGAATVQLEVTTLELDERARGAWARPRLIGRGEVGGRPEAS